MRRKCGQWDYERESTKCRYQSEVEDRRSKIEKEEREGGKIGRRREDNKETARGTQRENIRQTERGREREKE